MSIYKGKDGQVILDTAAVIQIRAWNLDVTSAILDATSLGDNYKVKVTSFTDWKGSLEAIWDPENTDHAACFQALEDGTAIVDAQFFVDSTHYYEGDILVVGVAPKVPVADLITATITFEGTGPLTYNASP